MSTRTEKVAGLLRREIATILQRELEHEDLGLISVTDVEVSRDLGQARVYVSVLDSEQAAATIAVLNDHSGEIRHLLASAVRLRATPALKFVHDKSGETGQRIADLLSKSRK